MDSDKFALKVKELLSNMTEDQKKKIKKNHPFRKERERIIRLLSAKGVESRVIAAISGVSTSSVSRIIRIKSDDNANEDENRTNSGVSFEAGIKTLCRLLFQLVQKK